MLSRRRDWSKFVQKRPNRSKTTYATKNLGPEPQEQGGDLSISDDALEREPGFKFDAFHLDRRSGLCRLNGSGKAEPIALGSRALAVLKALVESDGELVTKQALMQAAWPDTIVEEGNLTVQISTLRKVLDEGRTTGSCIQTVIGRGYRFRPTVEREAPLPVTAPIETKGMPPAVVAAGPEPDSRLRRRPLLWALAAVLAVCLTAAALLNRQMSEDRRTASEPPPRLSLVVLPFQNLSGDPQNDHLADGITDDLTTELSLIPGSLVVARQSAYAYKGRSTDMRQIGRELRVRYALEGSIRRIGDILRVNVQLISAETGTHLWSDRFDEGISQPAAGQEGIATRLSDTVGFNLVEIERARGLRERPTNPDSFDLMLRAHSMAIHLPPTPQRNKEALALYEQALVLDPMSARAMAMVAYFLVDAPGGWGTFDNVQRAGRLLKQARALDPRSALVLNNAVYWLRSMGRCAEVIEATEHAIQIDPKRLRGHTGIYNELAVCKTRLGHAEEELALQALADQLNPRSSFKFSRYRHMGFATLMLGQDTEAIAFFQRSLALNPENSANRWTYRMLAAAYARSGQIDEAKRSLSEGDRIWPYFTVRGVYPEELSSPIYVQQIRNYQNALRLAGARDHAEEDADFGVPADGRLRSEAAGRTPTQAPGVKTIRTVELVTLMADERPLIFDTVSNSWGRSVPGAIGLKFSGLGGSFDDEAQDRLGRKMAELTAGDWNRPLVAVGWNSERFDGHNLALRLAALGYTRVYWYRGGREAWEVADLPETELALQDW